MSSPRPACWDCKHYLNDLPMGKQPNCAAFPKGIPDAIYEHGIPHTKPWPGDNGIQFEPREAVPSETKRQAE